MCSIREYKIPKFNMNVESLQPGEHRFSLNMNANIMIPRDAVNNECIAEITISYNTEDNETIMFAVIRGNIVDAGIGLEDAERCSIIKAEVLPTLYTRLRNFIETMLEGTNVGLPNIPPVEQVSI